MPETKKPFVKKSDYSKKPFNKNSKPGGRGNYGDKPAGPRELFETTCADCKNKCKVPFKPTGEKPVLCGDCFQTKRGLEPREFRKKGNFNGGEQTISTVALERQVKSLQTEVASLHQKLDSLGRATKIVTDFVADQTASKSLRDVMDEVGVIDEVADSE